MICISLADDAEAGYPILLLILFEHTLKTNFDKKEKDG